MSWETDAVPTFWEQWPHALRRLSFATIGKPLSPVEVKAMLCGMAEFGPEIGERNEKEERLLQDWLASAIAGFPFGAFVKLGSRSPKDSWLGHSEGFKCENAGKAWRLLMDASERMYEDLSAALANDYWPWLIVREWKDIPEWQEFRCFVKDGELVGASQYDYLHCYREEIQKHIGPLAWGLKEFFLYRIKPVLHVQTVVLDVWLKIRSFTEPSGAANNVIEGTLVELNPWWTWTDPCLFDWTDDKFDRRAEGFELRYRTDPEKPQNVEKYTERTR